MMRKYVLRFVVAAALFVALLLPLSPGAHGADLGTERSVFEFLTTELGLNSAAACGVLANIEAESNFILTSYGDGGTSYGLCQWHDGRFDALQSFCLLQGYDYWSLEGQLNYLAYELRTRYQSTYAALRRVANTSDGAYEAGYAWCVNFEVPANREEKGVIRGRTAQFKYWLRYGDSSSDFSASVGITSNGYNSSLSDWPDTSSSFYWEAEENQAEPTAPISTPSSASQVPASSLSEYMSGKCAPRANALQRLADALQTTPEDLCSPAKRSRWRISVKEAAACMDVPPSFIKRGLQTGALSIGSAVLCKERYRYFISPERLRAEVGPERFAQFWEGGV